MDLSERQEAAFTQITAQLTDLSADIEAALGVSQTTIDTLRAQVTNLEGVRDALMAEKTEDDAMIVSLNDTIQDLESTITATEDTVVSRLEAISGSLTSIDTRVEEEIDNP